MSTSNGKPLSAIDRLVGECPARYCKFLHENGERQHYVSRSGKVCCFRHDSIIPEGWQPSENQQAVWNEEGVTEP